jgi:hypothetical protein
MWGLPAVRDPARLEMIVAMAMMSVMMILIGLEMTTIGLNSNGNKTESNCSVNKKSNHDSDNNCEADDDETLKSHPIEPIFVIDRLRHYHDEESACITSTRLYLH